MATNPTATVRVKKGRAKPLFCKHPWIFSGTVDTIEGDFQAGDIVEVVDITGKPIGKGYINAESKILVRLLTWDMQEQIDGQFWRRRLASAVDLRTDLLDLPAVTNAYRVVFSEGDGLPGLIVDRYGQSLVVQFLTAGMNVHRDEILAILGDLCAPTSVLQRSDPSYQAVEGVPAGGMISGKELTAPIEITENGLRFLVDVKNGHKTGFYLDQRENRLAASRLTKGRRVLDCFTYTGAFAVYADKIGGAAHVVAIDSSESAVELGRENARLNGAHNIEFRHGDVSSEIRAIKDTGETFDMAVLDPPKLARTRAGVARAGKKYRETNLLAMQVLKPGGILVTCSCSQHVSEEVFLRLINEAAREAGRNVQILEPRTQAADHPISAACPETKYLKCLFCRLS